MEKPIIAITMGDPAGIGPELIVKVLSQSETYEMCRPLVVGDPSVMREAVEIVGTDLAFEPISSPAEARFAPPRVDVLRPEGVRIDRIPRGQVDPAMGQAAALCLRKAFELAMAGEVHGVISAPLNKEAFHLAGYDYMDELAYLADFTGSADAFILGVVDSLWTVAVTEHVPFRQIAGLITKDRVLRYIERMHEALVRVGIKHPRIAVAALNVHAGEGGLFGREEIDEIGPAIEEAQRRGIDAQGPFPADTLFLTAMDQGYDGVVCMYHDQANIARKLLARRSGATLFMGLPVVCGTTAHGTAFDIAGRGIAEPGSLAMALKYTARLSSPK